MRHQGILAHRFSQTSLPLGATRLAILALILYGAWLGLTRAGFVGRRRLTAWLAVAVPLLAWQSVAWWLALAVAMSLNSAGMPVGSAPAGPVVERSITLALLAAAITAAGGCVVPLFVILRDGEEVLLE